jgi:rod shape-determining protein MreD
MTGALKRKIMIAIFIFLAVLLQYSVFSRWTILAITPNLLLGLTCAFGLMYGKNYGMISGLIMGLIIDAFSGGIIGLYALIYCLIGYLNGHFHTMFFPEDHKLPILALCISDFGYGLLLCFLYHFIRGDFHILYYILNIIMPELVITVLLMIPIYIFLLLLEEKISIGEQRREHRSV